MAAKETVWLVQLLKDLYQKVEYNILIFCHNLSLIHMAKNPTFHARTNMWRSLSLHYRESSKGGILTCSTSKPQTKLQISLRKDCQVRR